MDKGNTLGVFVKVSEQTKKMRYTSYAKICVYMDISQDMSKVSTCLGKMRNGSRL